MTIMAQQTPFHKNLSLLSEKAPEVAWKLGEEKEPLPDWEPFELSQEVCFVLGVAGGLNPLLPHLIGDRHLVLVDWEPAHIHALLHTEEATKLLSHLHVHIAILEDNETDFQFLQGLFSGLTAQVEIHKAYREEPFAQTVALRLLSDNQAAFPSPTYSEKPALAM